MGSIFFSNTSDYLPMLVTSVSLVNPLLCLGYNRSDEEEKLAHSGCPDTQCENPFFYTDSLPCDIPTHRKRITNMYIARSQSL